MSADRELLELAAKAAGIALIRSRLEDPLNLDMLVWNSARNAGQLSGAWNPLADDGDALRLGAAIEMELEINKGHVYCRANHGCREGFSEFDKEDTLRAMRRAITRAAAAIGEAMP